MIEQLLQALLGAWHWLVPWVVIAEYERGVRLRLGRNPVELEPGLRWIWPFGIDQVWIDNVVPTTDRIPPQSLTTRDGIAVVLGVVITWRIHDIVKFITQVEGRETVIADCTAGIVADHVARADWSAVLGPQFVDAVYRDVRKRGFRYGVGVESVVFSDLARCKSLRLWQAE